MLARRLGVAAALIGLAVGTTFHLLEARRVENASLDRAAAGARHFESPAMRMALGADAPGEHAALTNLLDRAHFVAVRVFDAKGGLVYESWQDLPSLLMDAARSHRHDWPARGQSHRQAVDVAGERLILVVLPLTGSDGRVVGYVESVSRLDGQALHEQRSQVRGATLAAVASALVTASVLYPMLLAMLNRSSGLFRSLLSASRSWRTTLGCTWPCRRSAITTSASMEAAIPTAGGAFQFRDQRESSPSWMCSTPLPRIVPTGRP
jgi:hypothetical protein